MDFFFLSPIPSLLFGDFQYSNVDYNCQIDVTNLRSAFMNGFLTYEIPVNLCYYCYLHAWIKMRRGNNSSIQTMTQIQRISSQRDLVVLFRICYLVGLLIVSFIPSLVFLFIYFAIEYIPWWSGSCLWFGLNLSTTSVIIILPFISPHVYNFMKNHFYHRRYPTSVGPHPDRIR